MTERIVMINNKIYSLKFGIKSLIVLAENSNLSEPEMRRLQFFLAIQNNQVSYEESLELLKELEKNIDVDSWTPSPCKLIIVALLSPILRPAII